MTINNTHQPRTMRTACGWWLVAGGPHCRASAGWPLLTPALLVPSPMVATSILWLHELSIFCQFVHHFVTTYYKIYSSEAETPLTPSLLQFMDVIICKLQSRNRKYSWIIGNLHHASSDHLRFLMKSEPQPQPQDAVQLPVALSRALRITLLAVRCDICRDICTVYEEPQIIVSSPAGSLQEKVGLREQGAAAASTQHRDNMSHTFRDIAHCILGKKPFK